MTTLASLGLQDPNEENEIEIPIRVIASSTRLVSLSIELDENTLRGWSTDALTPLASDPLPKKCLRLTSFPLDHLTFELIRIFPSPQPRGSTSAFY